MPVYEYRCKSCGRTHEIEHGFNDKRPTECPSCGGQLARVFHPVGVVFKGSGFHKTDYSKSGLRPQSTASSSDTPKTDGKASQDKPATTKESAPASTPAPKTSSEPKKTS